jgi:hypothetical protein
MKITFAIMTLKHLPVDGCKASWQRGSRFLGVGGLKF